MGEKMKDVQSSVLVMHLQAAPVPRLCGPFWYSVLSIKVHMELLVSFARSLGLLTPHCELMIAEKNYYDSLCVKQIIGRGLNFGIVAGSIFLQLPQIARIISSKSVEGLSEMTFLFQVCMII